MTRDLANAFVAEAERRWLYGHPHRAERARRPLLGRRRAAAGAHRTARAPQSLRMA